MEITPEDIANYLEAKKNMALDKLGILPSAMEQLVDNRKEICSLCPNLKESKCSLCGCDFPDITYAPDYKCKDNPPQW